MISCALSQLSQWQDEARAFTTRDLSTADYVYVWADGVHLNVRLDEARLCLLVIVDGRKELVPLAEGYRSRPGRGPTCCVTAPGAGCAPVLAVGDGALGFWTALREVSPDTRDQRCWFHKIGNLLTALPKSAHPGAKKALAEIWNAEDRDHARRAVAAFKLALHRGPDQRRREGLTVGTARRRDVTPAPGSGAFHPDRPIPGLASVQGTAIGVEWQRYARHSRSPGPGTGCMPR